jgi:hypothetical protein
MDELLKLLSSFEDCLSHQMRIFRQLLPVLDREEELVVRFDVGEFEKLVVEKDQIVRRAHSVEERRLVALKRVCFLVGYDARGELPSLRAFLVVLDNYAANVAPLLDAETAASLEAVRGRIHAVAAEYLELFRGAAPRIGRNQTVLAKMARNFERSLAILRTEASLQQDYDAAGRARLPGRGAEGNSFVRVKA